MEFRDQSENVRRLQQALEARGYALPRYGADGDFGNETAIALRAFADKSGFTWRTSQPVPEALLDALGCGELPDDEPGIIRLPELDVPLFDLRDKQRNPHPKSKISRGKTVVRSPAAITSIVLHQTAVPFGPASASDQRLAERSLNVACHAMAFRRGFVTLPCDPLWYVHHADRLNATSLGLEVEGNYPGLIGRKVRTGVETPLTEATVRAARAGIKLLLEIARRIGCDIKYIYAHRQADIWRTADPGEELWQRVALEYAVRELGLKTLPSKTFAHPKGSARDGVPIPIEWDPNNGVGKY